MRIYKEALPLLFLVCYLAYYPVFSAPTPNLNRLYGMWMGVQGADTVFHDYNSDGKVIIMRANSLGDCKVIRVYSFRLEGVKVIFTPTEGPKLQSAARIKKLTANVLEQVSGGGKAGKLLSFSRVSGHPCDLASAQDIDPSQRGSAIGFLKGLKYVFLFYLVFVFGAFVVVVRNLFNARFILPFVGKWIGVTIGGCLVLYGSAYGFYLSENYDKWLVNGLVNKGFTYFMPYMVSYGEGVVEKDSLKFWLVTLFVTSFYLSFPTIAWELWQKKLYQGTFFHRVIKWAKSAYKWGMITVLTLVAFTSIVSPSGPYSWIALIIGYIGIIKALRYTPERLSRHIGKQVEKWEDAEAIKQ